MRYIVSKLAFLLMLSCEQDSHPENEHVNSSISIHIETGVKEGVEQELGVTSPPTNLQELVDKQQTGTLHLANGTYTLKSSLILPSDLALVGSGNTVLKKANGYYTRTVKDVIKGDSTICLESTSDIREGDNVLLNSRKHGGWNSQNTRINKIIDNYVQIAAPA